MSTTLMPSSGPMVTLAPDADGAFARAAFLVTAGRPEDQGQRAYGGMRERQHRCVPANAGTHTLCPIVWAHRHHPSRHCERSEAIHLAAQRKNGLLRRFAPRNDGFLIFHSPCYSPFAGHGDGGEGTADNQLNSIALAAEAPLQHFQPVIAEKHFVVANKSRHAEDAVRESERCCIGQSCRGPPDRARPPCKAPGSDWAAAVSAPAAVRRKTRPCGGRRQ